MEKKCERVGQEHLRERGNETYTRERSIQIGYLRSESIVLVVPYDN